MIGKFSFFKRINPPLAYEGLTTDHFRYNYFRYTYPTILFALYLNYQDNEKKLSEIHQERLLELKHRQKPLSGIMVDERVTGLTFPYYLQWINEYIPYHVSFVFPESAHGEVSHIGLGPIESGVPYNGWFHGYKWMTHWRDHTSPEYENLKPGLRTPVEGWKTFNNFYGYYPERVDEKKLRVATLTPQKGGSLQGFFLLLMLMPNSTWRPKHCETKALKALHESTSEFSASVSRSA